MPFEAPKLADTHDLQIASECPRIADCPALGQPERVKAAQLTWLEAYARAEMLASHHHVRR